MICQVTNTSEEIYRALGRAVPDADTDPFVDVKQLQVSPFLERPLAPCSYESLRCQ